MQYLFILPLILSFSLSSHAVDGRFSKRRFGPYNVFLTHEFESGIGKVIIEKANEKIFEESGVDNHYSFGNDFDPVFEGADRFSGRDITGNGSPNLVVSNWTGGAHCCHFLQIFELGKDLKKLVAVEANSSSVLLVDLDHDGFPEIEFWDGAIDYQFASFAGSPGGRVVLKYQNGVYVVASHLMKRPMPTAKKIKHLKKVILGAFKKEETPDLPYVFLKTMMDLSYSGHLDLAFKLADETWPSEKTGLVGILL